MLPFLFVTDLNSTSDCDLDIDNIDMHLTQDKEKWEEG